MKKVVFKYQIDITQGRLGIALPVQSRVVHAVANGYRYVTFWVEQEVDPAVTVLWHFQVFGTGHLIETPKDFPASMSWEHCATVIHEDLVWHLNCMK